MIVLHVITALHLAVYLGIMWYGWQSYKLLRKRSWRFMGIGFGILLLYRTWLFIEQLLTDHRSDTEGILLPFAGATFLLIAFRMLSTEHHSLIKMLAAPAMLRSGAQPVEFWLDGIRTIVREEIAAASGTTTVTVKGPSATPPEVAIKEAP